MERTNDYHFPNFVISERVVVSWLLGLAISAIHPDEVANE